MSQVQQLMDMGFREEDARRALQQVNYNTEQAIERLLSGFPLLAGASSPPPSSPTFASRSPRILEPAGEPPLVEDLGFARDGEAGGSMLPPVVEDLELNTALEISLLARGGDSDGLPEGVREQGLPCGLRNVGNTCYVNSLLQTLLHVEAFRSWSLRYRTAGAKGNDEESKGSARREHCIRLALELRQLCAYSLFTLRRCVDPSGLLGEFVDDSGQKLEIGTQEDVGEFMLKFMDRLEEGLQAGSFTDLPEADGTAVDVCAHAADTKGEVSVAKRGGEASLDAEPAGEPAEEPAGEPAVAAAASEPEPALEPGAQPVTEEDAGGASKPSAMPVSTSKQDVSKKDKPTPIQTLLFGRQVQTFSYHEVPPCEDGSEAAAVDAEHPGASSDDAVFQANQADAPSQKGRLVVSEERNDFLQIFLDVRHKSLYNAWEAANCTEVDYKTPSGQSTTARTSIAIERLPKLLFFQLQRVIFDHEKKVQVKLDEAFDFDSTIHADRFLVENRDRAAEASRRVRELRRQHEELTEALTRFEDYRGRRGVGITEVFELAAQCLEENVSRSSGSGNAPDRSRERSDPDHLAGGPMQVSDLRAAAPTALRLLRELHEACHAEAEALRSELKRLSQEIDDAYKDLREHPYELHAIWVHQGIAGSGHYWAYLRDRPNNRWIRFDDALVSVVEWEDLRSEAVGKDGSNTSAYVLVYLERELSEKQERSDQAALTALAKAAMPPALLQEIHKDNERVVAEQKTREEQLAEQQLRQHAEAIFQHYAGLIHKWEPRKRTADQCGSALDASTRKKMHDAALLGYELFLYRQHGEQEVWTYFVEQSIAAQRAIRAWKPEEEPIVLFYLGVTLRSQKCYSQMIRDVGDAGVRRSEFIPLDNAKFLAQYNLALTQAYVVDEAISALQEDRTKLVECIGALALVWGHLEPDDKFRQNEILLVMSTLLYNVVDILEKNRQMLNDSVLSSFQPALEYFLLLLQVVEWPKSWKAPVIARIQSLCPAAAQGRLAGPANIQAQKEAVLRHPVTRAQAKWEEYESKKPEPGQEFFDRHRQLYGWAMQSDEAIAQEFVAAIAPELQRHDASGVKLAKHPP
eukprot:TRINITY_DN14936_c0_g2_i1.p1 TRINITY_DN14936_c0_g2~~TRINITY_DN14936_c0_g2_i1.p1  ORF type:complete len:1089 (+),score=206.61 TRINITY_DN14936_c0_g2_i1:132-3398(+)